MTETIRKNELPGNFDQFEDALRNKFVTMKELKDSGKNVVGIFCTYTPKEILYAADIVPVNLCGVSDAPIAEAERDLPANLCPLIKSSYGHAITDTCPFFYFSDMVLGETTCDGKKKMFEILDDEVKETFILEIPQSAHQEAGIPYYVAEMKRLITRLEEKFGVEITEEKLKEAIHQSNLDRENFENLLEMAKLRPSPMTGMDMSNVMDAYNVCFSSKERNDLIDDARANAQKIYEEIKDDEERKKRPRILLTGGPNSGVKNKIISKFDELGIDIVVIDSCNGIKEKRDKIDETMDPLEALARKYMGVTCSVMAHNENRFEQMGNLLDEFQVDAVVEIALQACHTFQIEARKTKKFITEERNLPYLFISTDYSTNDMGQLTTRIEAFAEML